jgi:sensor histidine kinase YesM
MPLLLGSSITDVVLLFLLTLSVYLYLIKNEAHAFTVKGVVLTGMLILSVLIRYISESYFLEFGLSFDSEVSVKFLYTKIISSLILIGVTIAYYVWGKYNVVQAQKLQTEMEKKQMELDYLKSRINPHFLFNTLGSIHSLAIVKSDQTAPMIEELSALMRYMFYDCQEDKILLVKEISFIENYIQLHQLKSQKPLDISFEHSLQNAHYKIEPLLFISFVENAFKHGNVNYGGTIAIALHQSQHGVTFTCTNTLAEITNVSTAEKQSGFGMKNIQKRLNYLYPEKHRLTITESPKFLVSLILKK